MLLWLAVDQARTEESKSECGVKMATSLALTLARRKRGDKPSTNAEPSIRNRLTNEDDLQIPATNADAAKISSKLNAEMSIFLNSRPGI